MTAQMGVMSDHASRIRDFANQHVQMVPTEDADFDVSTF